MDLLGVSETHIPWVGSMKLGDIEFFYLGRKDGVHRQGLGLIMNKEAAKSCLGWVLGYLWIIEYQLLIL